MAVKNIDDTIKKLLQAYAKYCENILNKETQRIQKQKFFTDKERQEASREHTMAKNALEFLNQIASNPKKYLYSGKDLIYAPGGLYDKLLPILGNKFDRDGKHLLVRLSEKIAHHVKYGKNDKEGNWIYNGPNRVGFLSYQPSDLEAEAIISMNKTVQLWNANDFVAAIKGFVPASLFAVDKEKTK